MAFLPAGKGWIGRARGASIACVVLVGVTDRSGFVFGHVTQGFAPKSGAAPWAGISPRLQRGNSGGIPSGAGNAGMRRGGVSWMSLSLRNGGGGWFRLFGRREGNFNLFTRGYAALHPGLSHGRAFSPSDLRNGTACLISEKDNAGSFQTARS
jgi:hypothetical protein